MSTLTPTINLKKPDGSDPFLTTDFDDNYDKIDAAIAALRAQVAGGGGGGGGAIDAATLQTHPALYFATADHVHAGGGGTGITQTQGDARYVRTVNGTGPDGAGNVAVAGGGGGTAPTTEATQDYLFAHTPFSDHEGHNFGASMAAGTSRTFTLCSTTVPAGISGRLSYDGALQLGGGGSVGGSPRTTDHRVDFYINGTIALIGSLQYRCYLPGLTNGGGYVIEMPFVTYRDVAVSNIGQLLTLTATVTQVSGAGLVYAARARALMGKT